jgi:hypothetical protein
MHLLERFVVYVYSISTVLYLSPSDPLTQIRHSKEARSAN